MERARAKAPPQLIHSHDMRIWKLWHNFNKMLNHKEISNKLSVKVLKYFSFDLNNRKFKNTSIIK